jgi:23S rRNA pseudouridine1911/1915/1917 synthase
MSDNDNISIPDQIDDEIIEIVISDEGENYRRLDQFLSAKIEKLSRNSIQKLFELGLIGDADGAELKQNKMPPIGTRVKVAIPPPQDYHLGPKNIPLEILFEDDNLIFINKPQGLVVHPAPGNWKDTLVNALLYHCPNLPGIGHTKRPGIVHRLDKGTSGVMVVAKSSKCHEGLVNLFKAHDLTRKYECIATGALPSNLNFQQTQIIQTLIGRSNRDRKKMTSQTSQGKEAKTMVRLLQSKLNQLHHFECQLHTGRTHQIRVHLSEIFKTPILGDTTYGRPSLFKELITNPYPFLHAKFLSLKHPISSEILTFETVPPESWKLPLSYLYS